MLAPFDSPPHALPETHIVILPRPHALMVQLANARNVHTPAAAPGLLDTLLNRSRMPMVPLDQVFPGKIQEHPISAKQGDVKVTTFPSGMKVITKDVVTPMFEAAAFVDVGSRYEPAQYAGITNFLERMLLKSTTNRSAFRFTREMGRTSTEVSTQTTRDSFAMKISAPADSADIAVGTLADLLKNPAFLEGERQQESHSYLDDVKETLKAVDIRVNEMFLEAAYSGKSLGKPLYGNATSIHNMTSPVLFTWFNNFFTPDRMVFSAVGVDHEAFASTIGELFEGTRKPSPHVAELAEPAVYTGGEVRQTEGDYEGLTHIALGFQSPNWTDAKGVATLTVLQTLLGGGSSFSSGGPGKGMCSRLHKEVLSNPEVESALSFSSIFNDSGVFGIYGVTTPNNAENFTYEIVKQFQKLNTISTEELERAKKQTISNCLTAVEIRAALVEEMGRNIMSFGEFKFPQILNLIKEVTAKDIQALAEKMVRTAPTLATFGNAAKVPRYDVIASKFK